VLPVKTEVTRKRLRKFITDLILIGCKLVSHGRRWIVRVSEKNPWFPIFRELYRKFLLL
jgi:hypothetical protein